MIEGFVTVHALVSAPCAGTYFLPCRSADRRKTLRNKKKQGQPLWLPIRKILPIEVGSSPVCELFQDVCTFISGKDGLKL
ncbi:MAG: hypothetical protein B1H11_10125 [Desulfobacteraceae bacterium 4484_190.1]|nr:MAG: hypothetical protein B1H11_10125 [Desulfobacteraceae bacterium 4484_190.1]